MIDKPSMPVVPEKQRPRRRGGKRLLLLMIIFFAVLSGVLFFQSSFSKIHQIRVSGLHLITESEVIHAADVNNGDHYFLTRASDMARKIERLGAVESAKVTKRFPGLVQIEVKERPVVALELGENGELRGLLPTGYSIVYRDSAKAAPRPLLTGWTDEQLKKSLCQALAAIPPEMLSDVSEIRPSVTDAYEDRILIYTRSRYEVITRIAYLAQKMPLLDDYIYDMQNDGRTAGRLYLLETNYASAAESVESDNPSDASDDDAIEQNESIQ